MVTTLDLMCDTFVALGGDGVLLAKNSDRDPNEAQALRWYDAREHAPGTPLRTTWSTIRQVERTHAIVISQPWWMWGAEMGANEHGVVIGNEAVFTRRTADRGASPTQLLGMDLLRLGLERSSTRHEAVEVIVSLLEEHGQGGSASHEHPRFGYDNSYLVADREGAVVLETAGRHHATEEVSGPGRSISNGLTIPAFAERYADPVRGRVAQCAARRGRTTATAVAARSVADLIAGLRDHGQVGGAPYYSVVNGALSAPCAHAGGLVTSTQSTASWVADLRAGRHWVTGTSAPCLSLFRPVTVGRALEHELPTNRADDTHWWRHERLHRAVLRDWTSAAAFLAERDELEEDWLAAPPDPAAAAAESVARTEAWRERVGMPEEMRPRWLRALWQRWDRQAGL